MPLSVTGRLSSPKANGVFPDVCGLHTSDPSWVLKGQHRAGGLGGLDDVLQLWIARHQFGSIRAWDLHAELMLEHHDVGDRLRRNVVVEVQVELPDDAAGGAGGFGERFQLGPRVEVVVAFLRSLMSPPLCRVSTMHRMK